MGRNRCDKIWFAVSVCSFLLLAVSFLLMPLGEETGTELSTYALVAGGLFWGALLLGIVTQCVLAHRRRAWYAKRRNKRMRTAQKIGLISFFKNKPAAMADVALLLSLIGWIIVMIVTDGFGYICFVFASLFVFSFSMHCILNGKVFYHIFFHEQMEQREEKK